MIISPTAAALLRHARDALQGRQIALLENGGSAQRVQVTPDGYRLAARRRHRPAADDLVVGLERGVEAERFLREFWDRLGRFGLEFHAAKTRHLPMFMS